MLTVLKYLFILPILICNSLFAQLKQTKKTNIFSLNCDSSKVSNRSKNYIIDSLYNHYYMKYQREAKLYGKGTKVSSVRNVNLSVLSFKDLKGNLFGPETIVPNKIIEGDLNNDCCSDLIVSVYYNQGSRPRLDIYCYITKNKKLEFFEKHSIHSLGICNDVSDTSGRFFPEKIENGMLIGKTSCYKKGDPGCCPSDCKITYFKFENGFKFEKQEKSLVEF